MPLIPTKWTNGNWIPRGGLLAWHSADAGATGQTVPDASGNGRDLDTGLFTLPPDLVPNVINGLPALNFNGVTHDPPFWSGSVTLRHAFIVAGYADATFSGEYRGLLTGLTGPFGVLVGSINYTNWFNFGFGPTYQFRRFDVVFPESNSPGTFNNQIGVFEVSLPTGWSLNGIQIGRDRDIAGRIWKGYWIEQLLYDRLLADFERHQIYEYLAIKYLLWKQNAVGKFIWPFQPNWAYQFATDKNVVTSRSVSGAFKGRQKSIQKQRWELNFDTRLPEEWDTAVNFWDQHYPASSFIYRDDAYSPARETEVRFAAALSQQFNSYNDLDYSIQIEEV